MTSWNSGHSQGTSIDNNGSMIRVLDHGAMDFNDDWGLMYVVNVPDVDLDSKNGSTRTPWVSVRCTNGRRSRAPSWKSVTTT